MDVHKEGRRVVSMGVCLKDQESFTCVHHRNVWVTLKETELVDIVKAAI